MVPTVGTQLMNNIKIKFVLDKIFYKQDILSKD